MTRRCPGASKCFLARSILYVGGFIEGRHDVVVAEGNLKIQIFALRKALGAEHDFIRTEFGRG
jgi:hypothetical protein